jgi:hypothetical protein
MNHPIRFPLAVLLGVGLLLGGGVARASDASCSTVMGVFRAHPASPCASPVGFCTAGTLWGSLWGSYAFVMATSTPTGTPDAPGILFYTGASTITLGTGDALVGIDTGTVDLNPAGSHALAAILTVTGGTGGLAGRTGYLVLRGTLTLDTGAVEGAYSGQICGGRP